MKTITFEEAIKRYVDNEEVYLIYYDGTEAVAESADDITRHKKKNGEFGVNDAPDFKITTEIELADVQQTIEALREKLAWLRINYSYAVYEIDKVESAIDVLYDLESDVANME